MGKDFERGFMCGGEVLSGTDWILRDPDAWWPRGHYGTNQRTVPVSVLTGHWTAGEAGGMRQIGNHGPTVVRRMMARKSRRTGKPLRVSVAFVIGVPEDLDDPGVAPVWQALDPGMASDIHVGAGYFNAKAIGVEVVSCGIPGRLDTRGRPTTEVDLLGRHLTVSQFCPAQLRAWRKLAEMVTGKSLPGNIEIPRQIPSENGGVLTSRRFTRPEARRWQGVSEHFLTPGTTKVDAAGMLMGALVEVPGWKLAEP